MTYHRTCDGILRRDVLKIGVLGGVGLSLSNFLRIADAGGVRDPQARSGIFINLDGGPTHLDTFDMKPEAPAEYRGKFQPIQTNVPGIEICEHLPKLATCADKFAILRGVSHTLAAHRLGREYVATGTRPLPSLEYPDYGAVISKETEAINAKELPAFVAVPSAGHGPGFLGVKYAPLATGSTPKAGQPFEVRGMTLQNGLKLDRVQRRRRLLDDLDTTFRDYQEDDQLLAGLDRFGQQTHTMITSPRAREAFDISRESAAFAEPFGTEAFGMSCLLATRLIEAGVRFVTLSLGGWDTHRDNFQRLENDLLPKLDTGLSALFNGLAAKGLLASTGVFVTGEFGRTPKVNNKSTDGGRDHYPRCMFMLMAGGGIRGGQFVGLSDDKATGPANDAITPDDAAATFYHNLGIDHTLEYHTDTGRPVTIVRDGHVIHQLFD